MRTTVVIPTYNRADLLLRTLDSVYRQTRPADEVIVVDDGSTDDTRERVAAYPHPVRYHYQTNAHLGAARNAGLSLATGDALLFLDSDDLLLPPALEALESALDAAPDAALAYCRSQSIDLEDRVTEPLWDHEDHAGQVWEKLIHGNFIRSSGAALIRRSHLDRVGPYVTRERLRSNEDWDMFLRLAEEAPFARVDEPLFQYRVHGTSMSANAPAMYHWALVVLEMHRRRNAGRPDRLYHLAKAYDAFYEGAFYRWGKAAREDWKARRFGSALRRGGYLVGLLLRDRRMRRDLMPGRTYGESAATAAAPASPSSSARPQGAER